MPSQQVYRKLSKQLLVGGLYKVDYVDTGKSQSTRVILPCKNARTRGGPLYVSKETGKVVVACIELLHEANRELVLKLAEDGILNSPDASYDNLSVIQSLGYSAQYRNLFKGSIHNSYRYFIASDLQLV